LHLLIVVKIALEVIVFIQNRLLSYSIKLKVCFNYYGARAGFHLYLFLFFGYAKKNKKRMPIQSLAQRYIIYRNKIVENLNIGLILQTKQAALSRGLITTRKVRAT